MTKRDLSESDEEVEGENEETKAKKFKTDFSVKQFRKLVNNRQIDAECLAKFLDQLQTTESAVSDYFDAGGTCLELLQLLELPDLPQLAIIESATLLVLQVIANYPDHGHVTLEACRYLLNTHMTLVNKMLSSLASSRRERLVILKLLATMVAYSPGLAKEILVNCKFIVTLLVRHMDNLAESVRLAFIDFLIAFFVDGNYGTILQLLGVKYLLPSVMGGLRFDPRATVDLFLATLKANIIDNAQVPKPLRLKVFNTVVMRGLVGLYDWYGPEAFEEKYQKIAKEPVVNPADKLAVAERVHECLLTLCTSYTRGVIFRDPALGTGKTHCNPLMYSVLETCMGREDDFDSALRLDLVVQLACACPDLVRTIWGKVLPHLDPRPTEKWLKAMRFVQRMVQGMDPKVTISRHLKLVPSLYAQVVQIIVVPTQVLRAVVPDEWVFEDAVVKMEVARLILFMLQAVDRFLAKAQEVLPEGYAKTLRKILGDHLTRNMPQGPSLLATWGNHEVTTQPSQSYSGFSSVKYMTQVIRILGFYHRLAPMLVAQVKFDNVMDLLTLCDDQTFQLSLVQLLTHMDPNVFVITSDLFPVVMFVLAKNLRVPDNKVAANNCLRSILTTTGLIEQDYEMEVWIGSLKVKHFPAFVGRILAQVHIDPSLVQDLTRFQKNEDPDRQEENYDHILETLSRDDYTHGESIKQIRNNTFSKVTLMALKIPTDNEKVLKQLGRVIIDIFHLQADVDGFQDLVRTHGRHLPQMIQDYILQWPDLWEDPLAIGQDPEPFTQVAQVLFNLVNREDLSEKAYQDILQVAQQQGPHCLDLIYCHPKLHENFRATHSEGYPVRFIVDLTESLRSTLDLGPYLGPYRVKLYQSILKLLKAKKKGLKTKNIGQIIQVIGVAYQESCAILEKLSGLSPNEFLNEEHKPNQVYNVAVNILSNLTRFCTEDFTLRPLDPIDKIMYILGHLNGENVDTSDLALEIRKYLTRFPHQIKDPKDLFVSIVNKAEYCKENAQLALYLYEKTQAGLLGAFAENLTQICLKKGLLLGLLDLATLDSALGETTFGHLGPILAKTLIKPQKAGPHFEKHYKGFCKLVQEHIPLKDVQPFLDKVHKFETSEVFLAALLQAMFSRFFKAQTTLTDKQVQNVIMTYVHFMVNIFKGFQKQEDLHLPRLTEVGQIFGQVFKDLPVKGKDLGVVKAHETFKLFLKYCLKYGISNDPKLSDLLGLVTDLATHLKFSIEDSKDLLGMLLGHSAFMDIILDAPSAAKTRIFDFVHVTCKQQPAVMERQHVPIFLSAYNATMHVSDRRILSVLRLYEALPAQTMFYDFKPFLWGVSAGNFYSMRPDARRGLWRQPKTGDVLNLLTLPMIESTIVNFPVSLGTLQDNTGRGAKLSPELSARVYDLSFMLAVFSQLLSPENNLLVHQFTRSGALGLVVVALASFAKDLRMAACHVLSRFYYLLEGKRSGKDHLVWLRFTEALAKGTGSIENFQLNDFAAIFMARAAIALANPQDPMYLPMANYVGVKARPDLTKIPEVYTFLHSADVAHLTHRHFILQVLTDGLRTDRDLQLAVKTHALKLIMEIYTSSICDPVSRRMILEVVRRGVCVHKGPGMLCNQLGLLGWLYNLLANITGRYCEETRGIVRIVKDLSGSKECKDSRMFQEVLTRIIDKFLDPEQDDEFKITVLECLNSGPARVLRLNLEQVRKVITFSGSNDYCLTYRYKTRIEEVEGSNKIEYLTQQFVQTFIDNDNSVSVVS